MKKPVVLMIMDGFGLNPDAYGNAIKAAKTPNLTRLFAENPFTKIGASGMDVGLPDGSGLKLCGEIRKSSRVPIVLLTARDMETDIVAGLEYGADDYITKPFSLMVLRARIRALLRRTEKGQAKEYLQPPFAFHFASMEFYKEGRPVELSKTEQRILYLLVFNPGQIITRERLLEWVWPDGTEYVEDNALSVGIRRLRDKLEEDASKPVYIRTVYGKGYVWEMPV